MEEGYKICPNCKRMYKKTSYYWDVCPACKEQTEARFLRVKKFIRKNPKATVNEVVEECAVSHDQIYRWVRQERLIFAEESDIGVECLACGAVIRTGRFCEKCKRTIYDMNDMYATNKMQLDLEKKDMKIKKDSMHFLSKAKIKIR